MYFPSEYHNNNNIDKENRPARKLKSIMKSYSSSTDKLAVRDNLDDEISDDVEDDVFIRDGKMYKSYEDKRLKRPLMPPKKIKFTGLKTSGSSNHTNYSSSVPILLKTKKTKCWKYCEPLCYGFIAVVILIALICLAAILLTMFPVPLQNLKQWLKRDHTFSTGSRLRGSTTSNDGLDSPSSNGQFNVDVVPCTKIKVHKVWSKAITRINSETPIRKVDLNGDKIDDIVIGYGIDEFFQATYGQAPRCQISKTQETTICEGGLLALNGLTGETIWQVWTTFTVFSLYCSSDLTNDSQVDCVASGRGGLMVAVDGKSGTLVWQFTENYSLDLLTNQYFIDLYTVNPIHDLDGDQIADILSVHVEESPSIKSGHIKLVSGGTGKVIRNIPTPFREEVFVPLQVITQPDGTENLLILTGGQNTPGGLYTIRITSLMNYLTENDYMVIYRSETSGFMVPAILTDITGDGVEDIVVSSFNSTVLAFDGRSHKMIWSYNFPTSESVSSIVPGYFDGDNITDFMIKYNTGPGFPVYYYSQTTVLNGSTGKPLLDQMMTDSGGPNSLLGGISLSQNTGGDIFLHWQTECRNHKDSKDAYRFFPGSDVIQQSRADTCLLRFNASTVLKLYALSRHLEPPGSVIFSTDDLVLQLNQTFEPIKSPENKTPISVFKHPKMRIKSVAKSNGTRGTFAGGPAITEKKRLDETEGPESEMARKILNRKMISIEESNNNQKEEKPFIYLPYDETDNRIYKNPYDSRQSLSSSSQQQSLPDYEMAYDENEIPPGMLSLRNPNHGIRRSSANTKLRASGSPETLWDLEIEKEKVESATKNDDYMKQKRRRDLEKIFDGNQNLISSISTTGILVKPLEEVADDDAMDYIFVLNVRESENYPPLYLAEDVDCVEEKMRSYPNYVNNDMITIENELLAQCLEKRLLNQTKPAPQQYETQIVITRLTIRCDCEKLNAGETCSKFNPMDKQKWTGFMGNTGNGIY